MTAGRAPVDANAFAPVEGAAGDARRRFPDGFVWGTATSSFQIEGGRASRGESIWDRFCEQPGAIVDGSNGDVACGHHEHRRGDVRLLRELGVAAYRFSVSWPRVLPNGRGEPAQAGLDFYSHLVDDLLDSGIEPHVTLYHWDLPQVLEDEGGWPERATAEAFADYVDVVVSHLGDRVRRWTTLNEPFCSARFGYVTGTMAPGRTSPALGYAASHHLLLGHGLAVERIRDRCPDADASIVLNFGAIRAASDRPEDVAAAELDHTLLNRWYVEPIAGHGYPIDALVRGVPWDGAEIRDGDLDVIAAPIDVLGVNYYSRATVGADPDLHVPVERATAMGWEIYPAGLAQTLRWLHDEFAFPRYLITENWAAMADEPDERGFVDDQDRIEYLHDHLAAVHGVIAEGVPVEGYFVWSLLDNFEWAYGYTCRFGLVRVDYDTLERIPKASASWYAGVTRSNALAG